MLLESENRNPQWFGMLVQALHGGASYQLPTDYRLPQIFHRYKIWCAAFCDFILYAMFCECTVNLSSTLTKGLLLHLLVSCVAMCHGWS